MLSGATLPSVAAIDLTTTLANEVAARAVTAGLRGERIDRTLVLPQAERLGGVVVRFGDFDA